jgi:chorismate mutase/prephenate dehydratase
MNLQDLRKKIDGIDDSLLKLFEERMAVVSEIAEQKRAEKKAACDPNREEEKLNAVLEKAAAKTKDYARQLFISIIALSRKYQYDMSKKAVAEEKKTTLKEDVENICKMIEAAKTANASAKFPEVKTIACQGTEGSFAEMAADVLFNKKQVVQYMKKYDNVFTALKEGFCDYGVLPIENSTAGSVYRVYRAMQNQKFRIARSVRLKVDHHLVAPKGVKLEDIREVVSHEQALAQCDGFLSTLGKEREIIQTQYNNTAAAAEMVARSDRRDLAAICSRRCVEQYNLDILCEDIQDNSNNFTRFICISRKLEIYDNATKTDMVLTVKNEQGILNKVLKIIDELKIDLGKLESRPSKSDDEFMFYVTLNTSPDEKLFKLLHGLVEHCKGIEYLGSYAEVH